MNIAPTQLTLPQALERAVSSLQSGNLAEAERLCTLILNADPAQVDALHLSGIVLQRQGAAEAALERFTRACQLDPTFVDALYNRAVALGDLARWDEALAAYDQVLRRDSGNARAWNNRGNVLQKLERWAEALVSYDRALGLRPDHADALYNRALVLLMLARPREALESCARAVALAPHLAEAQWTKSIVHLLLGEFEEGWRLHEWRWKTEQMAHLARDFKEPLWLGETSLAGKTILLHGDQGFGDAIQMARYAPLVAVNAGNVILEVHPSLARLMTSLSPAIQVVARGAHPPPFDLHCPLGSLPLAFRTTLRTIPGPAQYLRAASAEVAEWSARLGSASRPRIGLAWSGNPKNKRDLERSIPFERVRPLLDARFEFHCLQTAFRTGDEALARAAGVHFWSAELRDFADTAALVAALDVVVTVDTAIAHLAGALGKPVWILLPHMPDYRWLLDRDDSPWYASARLFRQPSRGDWEAVIAKVRDALSAVSSAPR